MGSNAHVDVTTELDPIQAPQIKKTKEYINWNSIVAREEGENFIISVVEDIVKKAGDVVYEHYIQRRVVPFAVLQAKNAILELTEVKIYLFNRLTVQYLFLEYDKGENDPSKDPNWLPDEGIYAY